MTDETPSSTRRRFPLTLAAIAASAIAIPLYIGVSAMSASEDEAAEDKVAQADAPPVAADEASEPAGVEGERGDGAGTPTVTATPVPEAEPADDATAVAEEAPAAPPPAKPAFAPKPGGGPMGGFGEGGAAAPSRAKRKGSASGSARDGRADAAKDIGGMGVRGELDMEIAHGDEIADLPKADSDEDSGFEQQLQAGRLTAGIIDDRTDRKSLDDLRNKLGYDAAIAQAIPDHGATGAAPTARPAPAVLEIGLVMDTTGSMGDELSYLKTELRSIAQEVSRNYPGVEQRYALVAYRDHGDEYVVRGHGFESIDAFVGHLGSEYAGGGGDFPEAMDEGLRAASQLQWTKDAAKLVFLVADAPPHTQGFDTYVQATTSLSLAGVSVYPVASSGIDTQCEYLMRWAARTSGGQYLFLTDHSGIGNAHAAPHVESYELKALRDHMLDVIQDELGAGDGTAVQGPTAQPGAAPVVVAGDSWFDRHSTFIWILGGMFMFGFAVDMSRAWFALRRNF